MRNIAHFFLAAVCCSVLMAPARSVAAQDNTASTGAAPAELAAAPATSPAPRNLGDQSVDAATADYLLGSGDGLRISVFGEPNLTGEFKVSGAGLVSFPLIGDVQAAGKTVQELRAEIATALADGYLKDPKVSAEVITFRPYYVLGEVGRPGEYPYINGITVMNAIATAGGFSYRANNHFVFIKRADDTVEHKVRLNDTLLLSPGDTLRVAERYF